MSDSYFLVRGYNRNQLLLATSPISVGSAQVEILAWMSRMKRREVTRVELIDCRPMGKATNLNVLTYEEIDWKDYRR